MSVSPVPSRPLLEICLESVADCIAAATGGADRVELCADLVEGGVTPSAGCLELAVQRAGVPIMAMVRPRGGDFLYTALEFEVMQRDVRAAKAAGAAGVVFGVLTAEGELDRERIGRLCDLARPMSVTVHRAFDMTRDPRAALQTLLGLGVDRVLTSGQERSVPEGLALLRELVREAGTRMVVMPGCGIDLANIAEVARATGARELHCTAFRKTASAMRYRNPKPDMGAGPAPGEYELQGTDPELVRRLVSALRGATP